MFVSSVLKSESLVVVVKGLIHWALIPISRIYLPTVRSVIVSPDLRSSLVILGAP